MKRMIAVASASRSERGLLEPLIERIQNHPKMALHLIELPTMFSSAFEVATENIIAYKDVDIALCCFDRLEQLGYAMAFYNHQIPIVHLYSGSSVGGNVRDEVVGMMMSLCASINLCHDEIAADYCRRLGIEDWRIKVVGSIAFDDVELDYSALPNSAFDLVLINPDTSSKTNTLNDIKMALNLVERYAVIIHPNEDEYREFIIEEMNKTAREHVIYKSLPRNQFLALIEKAERYLTNSSSMYFEAPYFHTPCIHIGERNKYRKVGKIVTGGVDKIIKVLEELSIDERLLRKRLFVEG